MNNDTASQLDEWLAKQAINIDAARLHLRDDDPAALRHSIKRAYSYFKAIRDVLNDLEEKNEGK